MHHLIIFIIPPLQTVLKKFQVTFELLRNYYLLWLVLKTSAFLILFYFF